MPSDVSTLSNSETVATINSERFSEIVRLAATFEQRDGKAKDALYQALEKLFHFVVGLETNAERREFVEHKERRGKWGKVAQDNPFQPFVKLAFCGKGISDASRSQYAKVLRYAEFKRDKAIPLSQWLKQEGGIEGLYSAANSYFPSLSGYVDSQRLLEAREVIQGRKQTASFVVDKAASLPADADEGYVMALLHVDANGNAHVVEFTENNQEKLNSLITTLARSEAKEPTREAKPFYSLYRAVRLLTTIAVAGKKDHDRLITLSVETGNDGQDRVFVRAISTGYEGTLGEVAIAEKLAWIGTGQILAMTQEAAKIFCDGFELDGHWTYSGNNEKMSLTHSSAALPHILLLEAVPTTKSYYRARTDTRRCDPIIFHCDEARKFLSAMGKKAPVAGAYSGALRLRWEEGKLVYQASANWPVIHPLFSIPSDPEFADDRMFSCEMLAQISTAVCDLKADLKGWLVSTKEEDICAIQFDHHLDKDHISLLMPLIKTTSGHTTQTNFAAETEPALQELVA